MAASSSSNIYNIPDDPARVEESRFLYASNANVSNFVSVKLSSDRNYHLWKTQMLCLMKTHNMGGIVDAAFDGPGAASTKIMDRYDSLLKGWIFGSVNENVLGPVSDIDSAKGVWDKLKSFYDATISPQQGKDDIVSTKPEVHDTYPISEIGRREEDIHVIQVIGEEDTYLTKLKRERKNEAKKQLNKAILYQNWLAAESILVNDKDLVEDAISSDGSTVLHSAVRIGGNNDFVDSLISYINVNQVLVKRSYDGSTALHVAALVGNTYAAELLVEKNKQLLHTPDNKGEEPLHKAYENMHLDTIGYLLKALDHNNGKVIPRDFAIGVDLLVNAISAKRYNLASDLISRFPKFVNENDLVLLALAKTFPSGPRFREILIYPNLWKVCLKMLKLALRFVASILTLPLVVIFSFLSTRRFLVGYVCVMTVYNLLVSPLLLIVYILWFPFLLLYFLLWEYAEILVPPIKHIKLRKKEWVEATKVLNLVCDKVDELAYDCGSHHPLYSRPILEAACQNAHTVVYEILSRSPDAIKSIDKSGYDIIQLAIIHRSEKVYNLIYDIGENANRYRTFVDSSKNNILHLAGRLAPLHKLNKITGAALQLQRELQWHKEVKKLVFPTYLTKENIFNETPDIVFTREHENLVKEGEKWMKTTAESCTITAALITTIVFAAAITVPGGSNQETGVPLYNKNPAFITFAISDAISLFASSTALLVFLSILTTRFAEKDFLVSLPRRLLIGLFFLFLSTTSMMVAFGATLFLVFCDKKPWTLAPICGLAFIPIAFSAALQFPLMIDLFVSTHMRIFGKQRKSVTGKFKPDSIRGLLLW